LLQAITPCAKKVVWLRETSYDPFYAAHFLIIIGGATASAANNNQKASGVEKVGNARLGNCSAKSSIIST